MKKILLSLALATLGITGTSYGQVIYSETFGGVTTPGLPTGWSQHSTGSPAWQTSTTGGSTWGSLTGANNVPLTHGEFVIVDDAANPNQLHDTLKSPVFSLTSYSGVYLAYDYFFYSATNSASGISESCYVLGSSDAGTTWAIIDTVYGNAWSVDAFSTKHVSLASLSGANCMIAFAYSDGGGSILGCALNNVVVSVPPAGDISLTAVLPVAPADFAQTGSNEYFQGTLYNIGSTTITSFVAGYQVGAGAPVNATISGVSVAPFTSYNFTIPTAYVVASGSNPVTIWVNEPGGAAPAADDTMTTTIVGVDSLQPKISLIEEFNQASCDPCADAAPNVDSVYANNSAIISMVRYHVDWPGRDFMDSVTLAPFVQGMVNLYGVNGVPWAELDGTYEYPGASGEVAGALNSYTVQLAASGGSPIKIQVTPSYDTTTNTFTATATITSYTDLPAGLVARAALTVGTITYANNQSTESIPQHTFPEVAENMFGGPAGNTLSALISGTPQTLNLSWVKDHPWATQGNTVQWAYDSTRMGAVVVWVQDPASLFVYQSTTAPVQVGYIPANNGVNAVKANNGSLNIYPNPASNSATIALNITTAASVKMDVINMAGQVVLSTPAENRNSGISYSDINVSNFAAGEYIVRVTIGNEVLNKTLTIKK